MTKEIQGYKFNALAQGKAIKTMLKNHFGYPTQPGNVTTEAVEVNMNEGSEGKFYYIIFDETLADLIPKVVTTFNINISDI